MSFSLSIIVPIFNAEKSIERCMKSIYKQNADDIEIILVNDGSKDKSAALCASFAEKDSRVVFINKENGGAGSARNAGLDRAKGEYIYFLDADDEMHPSLLKTVLCNARENDADIVVFSVERKIIQSATGKVINTKYTKKHDAVYKDKESFRRDFSHLYYEGVLFGGPVNKLFKKKIIDDNNLRFPDLRRGQDEVFNLYYYPNVQKAVIIPDTLYTYYAYDDAARNKKYRLNYFKETKLLYFETIKNLFDEFDLNDNYTVEKYQNSFIYSLEDGFLLAWNPLEKLKKADKISFIKKILSLGFVDKTVNDVKYIPSGYEKLWSFIKARDAKKIYSYLQFEQRKKALKKILRRA
ncbi:MAG: glycosyltransferase [Clostridia bacterium]|nr:glycosyltransferase [Clostridia bacterium]